MCTTQEKVGNNLIIQKNRHYIEVAIYSAQKGGTFFEGKNQQRNTKLHRINVLWTVAQTVHFFGMSCKVITDPPWKCK